MADLVRTITFPIIFFLAYVTGQVYEAQDSAINSETLAVYESHRLEWACGEEICWLDLNTGETGT